MMTNLQYERIHIEAGSPVINHCGLPVEEVIDMLTQGLTFNEIMEARRELEQEDILACLEFAYAK
jgi:uncharacterized protein (DUF433 family)